MLHKLKSLEENVLTFESYNVTVDESVLVSGGEFTLISMWSPWQLKVAQSNASTWTKKIYPNNGDHDHFALTWETIAAYGDYLREGYTNGKDWITCDAYERYIVRDEAFVREYT